MPIKFKTNKEDNFFETYYSGDLSLEELLTAWNNFFDSDE